MSNPRDNARALLVKAGRVYKRLALVDPRYLDMVRRVEATLQSEPGEVVDVIPDVPPPPDREHDAIAEAEAEFSTGPIKELEE